MGGGTSSMFYQAVRLGRRYVYHVLPSGQTWAAVRLARFTRRSDFVPLADLMKSLFVHHRCIFVLLGGERSRQSGHL